MRDIVQLTGTAEEALFNYATTVDLSNLAQERPIITFAAIYLRTGPFKIWDAMDGRPVCRPVVQYLGNLVSMNVTL